MNNTIDKIYKQIDKNPILIYMKGSPKLPECGYSAKVINVLYACKKRFAYIDILNNQDIRTELPKISNWPTFPQLWIDGKLIGGCDIVLEMYKNGELKSIINKTAIKYKL